MEPKQRPRLPCASFIRKGFMPSGSGIVKSDFTAACRVEFDLARWQLLRVAGASTITFHYDHQGLWSMEKATYFPESSSEASLAGQRAITLS